MRAPVKALKQLDLLRRQLARLLLPIAERLLRPEFARAAAADARPCPLYALVVSVALDTALVELCVRAPDVERVDIFPL